MSDERRTMFQSEYGSDNFWEKAERYDYTKIMCEILKNIKFNYETEGAYSRKVLVSRIEDNIDMIKKHCGSELRAEEYFHMCFPGIALLCRRIELPEKFIKKYKVKPWHISLMQRTYFGISLDCKNWSYTESNCEISLGDKRPYGNSDVTGDIAEEYFNYNKNKELKHKGQTFTWDGVGYKDTKGDFYDFRYSYESDNQEFFWNIMDETNNIIQKMLKEVDYSHLSFINVPNDRDFGGHYTENWEICKSVVRNKKIEKLIKDE